MMVKIKNTFCFMKKIFICIMLLISLTCYSQTSSVKVTLKNGVTISGVLKEMDLTDHVTVVVSGLETKIPMTQVESVDNIEEAAQAGDSSSQNIPLEGYGNYVVTDKKHYPESFELKLDGQTLTMVLVKGGVFNMGFDDRHSMSMKSEPVHQVTLSSYYVSKENLTKRAVNRILGLKNKDNKKNNAFYATGKWGKAKEIVDAIADNAKKPYRLLTEAEWEYLSIMPFANQIFGDQLYDEWCSDYFDRYNKSSQINPQGPSLGNRHVTRSFNAGRNKWDRMKNFENAYIRIAIDADKL